MMEEKLKKIMSVLFEIAESEISGQTKREDIERWDSLNHLNLVVEIESEFDITLSPEEIGDMNSLESILEILKK